MWNIQKIINKGEYNYALVPEHPNASKNHYVLLHRVIMENHIGRLLTTHEVVHHKDHNKKNNDISNLEILDYKEHVKLHVQHRERKTVKLKCPVCEKEFEIYLNQSHLQKPHKYNCTCCSKECRGRLYRHIQLHGLNSEIQNKIDGNVIGFSTKCIADNN